MSKQTFSGLDVINLIRHLRVTEKINEEQASMLCSVMAKKFQLEIQVEEYKFRLNEA